MPRNAAARLLARPVSCLHCNHVDCSRGISCPDVRPEEVAIAALEMLYEQQPYSQTIYRDILGYKIESEVQEQPSPH